MRTCLIACLWLVLPGGLTWAQNAALANKARAVFEKHCHSCHGKDGSDVGGFGYVLDRSRLIESKKLVPGKPDESRVYTRFLSPRRPMPPREDEEGNPITVRPTPEEQEAVRAWIEAGAPEANPNRPERPFLTSARLWQIIRADVEQFPRQEQNELRYFSLVHLANAGLSDDELTTARQGLTKLVNSLSWGSRLVSPQPVGAEGVLFRIRLSDYGWSSWQWDCIVRENVYELPFDHPDAVIVARLVKSPRFAVRGDWFVAAASRPPLYHDILGLPKSARELERALLGQLAGHNIQDNRVARAGFNGSDVSENNRMIERHEIPEGRTWPEKNARWREPAAYWKSYDFASNTGRQNLFLYPLGPGNTLPNFQHDGGEIIFNLPNGLQAYLLVDGNDNRIDEGPIKIVSDRRKVGIGATVINGISCMSCHDNGMIPKDDQVREHVRKATLAGYSREEITRVLFQYPERAAFQELLQSDADRFVRSLRGLGIERTPTEPITSVFRQFNRELSLRTVAAEVGLRSDEFEAVLRRQRGELLRIFGPLVTGGTIKREVMTREFRNLLNAVNEAR